VAPENEITRRELEALFHSRDQAIVNLADDIRDLKSGQRWLLRVIVTTIFGLLATIVGGVVVWALTN
jgi:hypothetical protein